MLCLVNLDLRLGALCLLSEVPRKLGNRLTNPQLSFLSVIFWGSVNWSLIKVVNNWDALHIITGRSFAVWLALSLVGMICFGSVLAIALRRLLSDRCQTNGCSGVVWVFLGYPTSAVIPKDVFVQVDL